MAASSSDLRGPARSARSALRRWRGAVLAFSTLIASTAAAQVSQVVERREFPVERFRWTFARTGVLGAEWGGIPGAGSWDLGLWLGTAKNPLVLYRDGSTGDRTELSSLVARRTSATLMLSYSPWHRLELGLELPLILAQSRADSVPGVAGMLSSITGVGLGDLRLAPKIGLLRANQHGIELAIMPAVTLPSAGGADYRGEAGVAFAPELLVSRALGRTRLAANLGYRARSNVSFLNLRVGDELFGVIAAGQRVATTVEAELALTLATAARSPLSRDNQDHLEALAGLNWDAPGPLVVSVIGGLGLNEGFGTPDWRGVLAVRFGSVQRDDNRTDDRDHGAEDSDGDRVLDVVDRCPKTPEDYDAFQDEDGCPDPDNSGEDFLDAVLDADDPDRDGDESADGEDRCPDEPEDRDGFEDEDGCPDPDNDGDGTVDLEDGCPAQPGPADHRGCPDPDRDGDEVVDRLDNCPDERGDKANHGCAKPQRVVLVAGKLEILDIVHFALDRDQILRQSFSLLDNVAAVVNAHPEFTKIEVEGHTDSQGNEAYNKDLSQRRAAAVVKYLEAHGVAPSRLTPIGYGEERPVADNATKTGRTKNRRVEFRLKPDVEPAAATRDRKQTDFPDEVVQ
jgi:outer membrane protein OmpA-like peptidoglycan-associated protein